MPLGNQNICVEPNPKRIQFNKFIPARIKLHVPPDPMWKHLLCNLEPVWRSFGKLVQWLAHMQAQENIDKLPDSINFVPSSRRQLIMIKPQHNVNNWNSHFRSF